MGGRRLSREIAFHLVFAAGYAAETAEPLEASLCRYFHSRFHPAPPPLLKADPGTVPAAAPHIAEELELYLAALDERPQRAPLAEAFRERIRSTWRTILGFSLHLAAGALAEREALEALITAAGAHWRLDRMGRVERALLTLGAFELTHADPEGEKLPREIVIDEAVEMARIYGGDESPAFINGVLDAIARKQEAQDGA